MSVRIYLAIFSVVSVVIGLRMNSALSIKPFGWRPEEQHNLSRYEVEVSIQIVEDAVNRHGDDVFRITKEVREKFEEFMPESGRQWVVLYVKYQVPAYINIANISKKIFLKRPFKGDLMFASLV